MRVEIGVSILAALAVVTPTGAVAYPVEPQDSRSKALLALPPDEADRARRRELLADLQPRGEFLKDLNGNVYGATFVTWPYPTRLWPICREDSITLQFGRAISAGQIETQALFYVEGDPSLGGTYGEAGNCDKQHPGPKANWIAASTDIDALRAAQMFVQAEADVESSALKPEPCSRPAPDACRQWIMSVSDLSKLDEVETCVPTTDENWCYVISIGDVRLTIDATKGASPRRDFHAITSIKVDEVTYVVE